MKKSTKGLTKRLITAPLFDIISYNLKTLPTRLKKGRTSHDTPDMGLEPMTLRLKV